MIISLIAAASENNVLGKEGKIPWHLPADLQHFRDLTHGHPVIMGRRTYESIGHPLRGRRNIILSRSLREAPSGCELHHHLADALLKFRGSNEEIFIIGGAEIFEQMMGLPSEGEVLLKWSANRIYLTRVHGTFEGDAFFPAIPSEDWIEVARERHEADAENPLPYTFLTYERRKSS